MMKIAIIGMGLIGTSIGMALRTADERTSRLGSISVVGYDANRQSTAQARGRLAIDREMGSLADAARDAALLILAVPVQEIPEVLRSLATLASPGAVITDVSSTKAQVLAWAQELLPDSLQFVGGHPMAGRERSGPDAADPRIFQDAIYCVCPSPSVRQEGLDAVEALVATLGAKLYYIDPVEHDTYVGGVSHLPFLLSSALMELVSRSPGWREMAPLAATGFRDMTRLASGSATMHRDILATNRAAMIHWINETARFLFEVREQLEDGRDADLLAMFEHARDVREEWLTMRPNMRPGEGEFENISGVTPERPNMFGRWGRPSQDRGKR
ncbi:MAG TPA: prephenate dehydrogenase/arogenate dehydrogenase family protein [Roseiflexaceae bacterium]|nr:prephenate dehydrogenase/arogenate dehydrogenase family protein [Roseiflexaceae bacterium]